MHHRIGFGTYKITEDVCDQAIRTAIKTGYRNIDTASIYKNETYIGNTLKSLFESN